ncbi:formate dehydrogenase subunit alpha [Candidatus Methylopumilus universalis]|uniref:Formate dehydrogenase subunit alpha n=1 Tax=Candidatus Methylopumilus universalis TaxID=2588536 RepID=A0AAX1F0E4_9PROT|nr:formate dehydrogenase subunit alpha [Candidatus Methylopumilus universalis]QDC41507.1 formate dehydrogenase subunit alpha [Candidatus Methylopumilus universalis]QDC42789.1 formate dehydrogenase subunit alpha [Candidatus Methylopumilus universalis]QDC55177.1 formate dehydrogenase subunit alpha [Candidatus Methylopumilus universalis]QDC56457.1 formate dehydrogenase subunit alpha [Candidatus Methylopumilus universalis]QDC57747.1 formate dehydrogenase subunit alpha [Candidatus Methylopumilus un
MDDVKDFGTPKRISDKTVNLTIDGVSVSVPEGTSVMHAASLSGVTVPKLCATDSLEPFGSCRLCLVEIEGRRGYPASCTTPVAEGIKVHTQTPKLADIRRGVMELYISDHPLDCLTCATNGDCELQDMAGAVGLRDVRYGYEGENHLKSVKDTSNPYFTFDPSKCIVCSRCVRACEEVQGTFALTIQGRGFDSKVSAGNKDFKDSECVSCGACVQACPTATLIENTIIEAGVPEHSVTTTCAYCGVGCSFHAEMKGEEVVRMTPNKDGGANHGHSCVKGRFAWGYATHKDRITTPMIRKSIHDPWEKVTWDVAINYAASEIQRIQKKYGRDSVGAISSSRCTNEEVYVVQKLVRAALGNNNVDTCARVCHSPTGYGLKQTLGESAGTQNFDSVMHSDVIMIIGANPTDGHPVFASQMKRRLREGAKLIIVDPRAIDLVNNSPHIKADYHLKLKPGSNVAIVNALAHVIVTEKLMDDSFIKARCEDDAFKSWKDFITKPENSPEAMSAFTGVDAKDVRAAAKIFAKGGNAAIYYGLGVTEHSQGSTMVMGIANLAMLTGNIGREGVGVNPLRGQNNVQGACDMGSFPHEFPGYRHVSDKATLALFEKAWDVKLQNEPGLRIPNMLDVAIDGQFKALYCEGEDIAQSDPNTQHVTHALESMECVIVQDLFLNETAMYAHVFLPGSSFLEKNGTFTNAERRISRVRKVMSPKNGYEDWEITQMLSNALGYKMDYSHASDIMDEIARLTPTFKGVSYKKLDELGSIQWPCNDEHPLGTPTMHIDEFVRGKGKFIITEYVPTSEKVTQKYPLILTTGRILSQYNVGAQTRRTKNVAWHEEDLVEIHPHDAEERGIQSGDWVGIVSRSGETVLRAQITERVQPGVIYTTFHHPESGANVITTDNSDWATNCPEFKVTAVQVNKVTQLSDWQKQYQHFSEEQIEFAGKSKELKIH